jgi:transcription antitermination factor NusG
MNLAPWCAIQVRRNREIETSRLLREKGYEQFLPLYKICRRRANRVIELETPLFPGYLFCRYDWEVRSPIVTTRGVLRIVGMGNRPAEVPEEEIEMLRRTLDAKVDVEPWPYLQKGEVAYLQSGPLRGLHGIFEGFDRKFRLILSVTLLQRSIAVIAEPEWL